MTRARRVAKTILLALALLATAGSAGAQDIRLGASGSLTGVVSVDATWLFAELPSTGGDVRFGVRADLSALLAAPGRPSVAGSVLLDVGPQEGLAAHLGAGVVLMRAAGGASDLVPSALLLAGAEWAVADFLRIRLEGSLVPGANAAGIALGLVLLPFGGNL